MLTQQALHFQLRTTKEDYTIIKRQALAAAAQSEQTNPESIKETEDKPTPAPTDRSEPTVLPESVADGTVVKSEESAKQPDTPKDSSTNTTLPNGNTNGATNGAQSQKENDGNSTKDEHGKNPVSNCGLISYSWYTSRQLPCCACASATLGIR